MADLSPEEVQELVKRGLLSPQVAGELTAAPAMPQRFAPSSPQSARMPAPGVSAPSGAPRADLPQAMAGVDQRAQREVEGDRATMAARTFAPSGPPQPLPALDDNERMRILAALMPGGQR